MWFLSTQTLLEPDKWCLQTGTHAFLPIITCKFWMRPQDPQVLKIESCSMQVLLYRWLMQCQFHSKTLCSNFWIIHIKSWVARTDKDEVCHFRQNRNLFKAASLMKQTWTVTSQCMKVTVLIQATLHFLKLSLFFLQHTYLIIFFVNLYIFTCPCKIWLFLLPV